MADLSLDHRFKALRACRPLHFPSITKFGRAAEAYDLGGEDGQGSDDDLDDYGDGAPGIDLMARCLAAFARCWKRFDVEVAASVFNASESLIAVVVPDPAECSQEPAEDDLGVLVQLVSLRQPDTTVSQVAALLNLSEQAILQAVDRHPWMYLSGESDGSALIGHDGE